MRGEHLIREVFGESDSDDDADALTARPHHPIPPLTTDCVVESPLGVDGMIVAREALGADAQAWLLRAIRADDLVDFPDDESNAAEEEAASGGGIAQRRRNQAMRFGRKHLPRGRSSSRTPSRTSPRVPPVTATTAQTPSSHQRS